MKPIERDPLSPERGESSPVIERAPEVSADPHQLVNEVHRRTEDVVTPAEGEHEINETVELIDVGLTFNPSAYDSKRDYWEMDIVLVIKDQEFHIVIPNDAMHSIQDDLDANFPLGINMDETWWRE